MLGAEIAASESGKLPDTATLATRGWWASLAHSFLPHQPCPMEPRSGNGAGYGFAGPRVWFAGPRVPLPSPSPAPLQEPPPWRRCAPSRTPRRPAWRQGVRSGKRRRFWRWRVHQNAELHKRQNGHLLARSRAFGRRSGGGGGGGVGVDLFLAREGCLKTFDLDGVRLRHSVCACLRMCMRLCAGE